MQISIPLSSGGRGLKVAPEVTNWILCWILLPNLAFFAMYLIGSPPRHPEILATGAIGFVARKASFPVKYAAFVAALVYSILCFVSSLFNLAVSSLVYSLKFLVEIRPAASPEYLLVGGLIAFTLAAAWKLLRLRTSFEAPVHLICAAAAVVSFAGLDMVMAKGNRGHYKRVAPDGAAFTSAVSQTRFGEAAGSSNNLLVVVVEAMGLPRDPRLRQQLVSRWRASDISRSYDVRTGSTTFFGSTTSGEVRELCGRWGDYPDLMEKRDDGCLPSRLARKGYGTTAIHSFDGAMFDRTKWYPNVGFQSLLFRDDLYAQGANPCSGVFMGACDRDVPAIISKQLKQPGKPQFVYWLTVNSHLPVAADKSLRTEHCEKFDRALAETHAMTCRMFSLWREMDDSLARVLLDPDLPATDVLLVGDHAPPFFDREERTQFHGDSVPWVLLKHKGASARPTIASTAKTVPVPPAG